MSVTSPSIGCTSCLLTFIVVPSPLIVVSCGTLPSFREVSRIRCFRDCVSLVPSEGLGADWHRSIPRLTPVDRRNSLVFLSSRGRGWRSWPGDDGTGDDSFGGSDSGWRAKSTFAIRFDALTGGEDGCGGGRGVCCALTWGTGTFPLGSLGVVWPVFCCGKGSSLPGTETAFCGRDSTLR